MRKYIFKHKIWLLTTVLFRVIGAVMQVYMAIMIQQIIDVVVTQNMNAFISCVVFAAIYFILMGFVDYITNTTQAIYLKKTLMKLKYDIFKGILEKDYQSYFKVNTAEYLSSLTNDINLVETNYITPYLMMIGDIVIFIVTTIVLIWINPWVTVSMFAIAILLMIIPNLFGTTLESRQNQVSQQQTLFTKKIKDIFQGYEVIKSYQIVDSVSQEFQSDNQHLESSKFRSAHLKGIAEAVSSVFAIGTQVAGIAISGYFVIMGTMSVGLLVAVVQLGNGIQGPIMWIMQKITMIKGIQGVNEKLINIIKEGEQQNKSETIISFNESIKLTNLSFAYKNDIKVLNDINLNFEKGKKYVIVGASGCGKTTLMKLLIGYYKDYEGQIIVDGEDIKSPKDISMNQIISMIHQNVYLFDRDIENNILLGKIFSEYELESSMNQSGVSKFLGILDNGIKTPVGENGQNLSGGQKQRVAIARALIQKTPILILDEGTSSLDNQTAYEIEKTLLDLSELTLLTITHKLNEELLSSYDSIIVMNEGSIVQIGNFEKLVNMEGDFKSLIRYSKENKLAHINFKSSDNV